MPLVTIAFGLILILAGLGTYVAADEPEKIGLLLAILGLLAMACGVASVIKKDMRKHLMHGAVLLALIGVVVPLWLLIEFMAVELKGDTGLKAIRIFVTITVSGLYLYTAIQSFVSARRKRKADIALGKTDPE